MRIVAISDTHLYHLKQSIPIPDGDMIIHAGDATCIGDWSEIRAFALWYSKLPHKYKIFVAGNHDWGFQERHVESVGILPSEIIYLQDSSVTIEGIKIYGSPWQPEFCNWAFNLPRGKTIARKWKLIPKDTNILVTHGPPYGQRDLTMHGEHVGCEELQQAIYKIRPKYHIFGHIHHSHGRSVDMYTQYINAAICDESYRPNNDPIVFDY